MRVWKRRNFLCNRAAIYAIKKKPYTTILKCVSLGFPQFIVIRKYTKAIEVFYRSYRRALYYVRIAVKIAAAPCLFDSFVRSLYSSSMIDIDISDL